MSNVPRVAEAKNEIEQARRDGLEWLKTHGGLDSRGRPPQWFTDLVNAGNYAVELAEEMA